MALAVAAGAALVAIPVTILGLLPDRNADLYLRVADDSPLEAARDLKNGPTSANIVRSCGIDKFTFDNFANDHTASTFVELRNASPDQLNCVVGQARVAHQAIAITRGIDTREVYRLGGEPTAYTRCASTELTTGTCRLKKPN